METATVNHTEFGLELKQATEITSGLTQILEERKVLAENYATTIQMEITKENLPIFKELRLKIRDNRTKGIESWHKTNKEFYLRGGQFVDAIKRKEIEENLRMEANLEENEKFFERQEAHRIEQLNTIRLAELQPYIEFVPAGINFGSLSDADYSLHLNGAKLQYDAKIAKEQQLEAERLEAEKQEQERAVEELRIEELHKSRKEIMLPVWDFVPTAFKLSNMGFATEIEFNSVLKESKDLKLAHDQKIESQRIENEKLKAEQEKARIEREKQAEIQAKKDAEIQSKLEEERKENARIQAELNAKRDAELKAEQEKADAEKKAKLEAEKLAKAPVKQQMKNWVDSFELPVPSTSWDVDVSLDVLEKFKAFKAWAKTQIENL